MPNGGSDCCGTCWFNARNQGDAGYAHADDPEPNFCTIRRLAIERAFWTYCANHPHHRPDRDPIPIGPVYVDDGGNRTEWQSSPDTEEVRQHLLELVRAIAAQPREEYPAGLYTDEVVVRQLGEFREVRAERELRQIAAFSPDGPERRYGRTRAGLVAAALEALTKLGVSNAELPSQAVRPPTAPPMTSLLGSWRLFRGENNGLPIAAAALPRSLVLTFTERLLRAESERARDALAGHWSVDLTREPMALDIAHTEGPYAGMIQPCVFAIAGNRLLLVFGDAGGGEKARPTGFDTTGGHQGVLFEFEAVGPSRQDANPSAAPDPAG